MRLPMNDPTAITTDEFSYADPADPPFKRFLIHTIERATGQPYLRWLYEQFIGAIRWWARPSGMPPSGCWN
jgi:hypothetical protein